MSGWIVFTVCFTTLLVGAWAAITLLEFYRADRRMKEAELRGQARMPPTRGRGRRP